MYTFARVIRRNDEQSGSPATLSHTVFTLLIVLLVLLILTIILAVTLLLVRRRRRARNAQSLPTYSEKRSSTSSTFSHHRRVMTRPTEPIHVFQEKQQLMKESSGPPSPTSPLPEIRITFPEEIDERTGKRVSGRVVMVHVGETSIGLEPLAEGLPGYREREGERMYSLDLDRIGGLTEKQHRIGWN